MFLLIKQIYFTNRKYRAFVAVCTCISCKPALWQLKKQKTNIYIYIFFSFPFFSPSVEGINSSILAKRGREISTLDIFYMLHNFTNTCPIQSRNVWAHCTKCIFSLLRFPEIYQDHKGIP